MKQVLSIIFIFSAFHIFGITVSGKIVDVDNQPIPFVSILIKGTTIGTTSNLYGSYSINISPGKYELDFRLLGYKLQEETIDVLNNNQILNVKLLPENFLLNEASVNANANNIEFNINKVLAISELYSDITYYRYFSSFKSNELLIALLNYSDKATSYVSFISGLNELFKNDDKVKFRTTKFANDKLTYNGIYKYVEHNGAGKTASKYTLKDRRSKTQIQDTILSGQYVINTKKIGDSIYFQCPGVYNEKGIGSTAIASIKNFIDAYYVPYYSQPDFKTSSKLARLISKIAMKNEIMTSLISFEKQITNFYPYKYDTLLFESRFKECLIFADTAKILSDSTNYNSFYNLFSYLQNVIHDNHIVIYTNLTLNTPLEAYNLPFSNLPIKIFVKNDYAYIEDVTDSTYKNLIGSKIVSVNDTNMAEYIKNKSSYISYTTQLSKENKLEESLFKKVLSPTYYILKIQKKDGSIEVVKMKNKIDNYFQKTKLDRKWMYYIDSEKTKLYIDLNSFSFSSKKALKEIEKNKKIERIVFDVLEYPNLNALDLIAHFTDKPLLSPTFVSNYTSNPFGFITHKEVEDHWVQENVKPLIDIPCVFLVRGTYSWGETFLDIIKTNKIGKLIGEETGGTNGDAIYNNLEIYGYKYTSIKVINNSNHLPANESTIKPDILFEKNEGNYLNYRDELIKYASTVPTN